MIERMETAHPTSCRSSTANNVWIRNRISARPRAAHATARNASNVNLGYPDSAWYAGTTAVGIAILPNARWFRYEWHIEYIGATAYRIYPRIYDDAGTLVYDYERFFQNDYPFSGSHSLRTWCEAGNAFGTTDSNLARNFGFGNEGPGGSTASMGYWYIGAAALSTTGWIGPR